MFQYCIARVFHWKHLEWGKSVSQSGLAIVSYSTKLWGIKGRKALNGASNKEMIAIAILFIAIASLFVDILPCLFWFPWDLAPQLRTGRMVSPPLPASLSSQFYSLIGWLCGHVVPVETFWLDVSSPQRLVSSQEGSFMLFSTFLTIFSSSFLALCSSSSVLRILLLSWKHKQRWPRIVRTFGT